MKKFNWDYPAKEKVLSHVWGLALREIAAICRDNKAQETDKVDIIRGVLGLCSAIEREMAEDEDD